MNPQALLQLLARLGVVAGQGVAQNLQQRGNPQAYAQGQENNRQSAQLAAQRWFEEQRLAREDAQNAEATRFRNTQEARQNSQNEFTNQLNLIKSGLRPTPSGGSADVVLNGRGYNLPESANESDLVTLGPDTLKELGITPSGTHTSITVPFEKAQGFFEQIGKARETHQNLSAAKQTYAGIIKDNFADDPKSTKLYQGMVDAAENITDLRQIGENITRHIQTVKPEKDKDRYGKVMAQLMKSGDLAPGDVANLGKIGTALTKSKAISEDDRNFAMAYPAANTTPATSQQQTEVRMTGLGATREVPVMDTKTNQLMVMNANDINAMNAREPGRLVMGNQQATSALSKRSQFGALHYSIGNARKAINDLPELDAGTRIQLANAMASDNPGVMSEFLRGSVASTMNEKQKAAVRSLQFLGEDALSLRNLMGLGAGSDMVRNAVQGLLPSGKSADKGDMIARMNQFEGLVGQLEQGNPGLGQPAGGVGGFGQSAPGAPGAVQPQQSQRPPLQFNFNLPAGVGGGNQ